MEEEEAEIVKEIMFKSLAQAGRDGSSLKS